MFRWSLWSLDFDGLLWAAFSVESCKNLLAGSERSRSFWNAGGLPSSIVARRESSSSFHLYEAATAREPRSGIGGRNDAITSTFMNTIEQLASTKLKMLIFYTLWLTFFFLNYERKSSKFAWQHHQSSNFGHLNDMYCFYFSKHLHSVWKLAKKSHSKFELTVKQCYQTGHFW